MVNLLDAALAVAATGLAVFPCDGNKQPVVAGGFKRASTDPVIVRSLFRTSLAKTIGMPTGEKTGIVIVDIDPRHDGDTWHEANKANLPATRLHRTMNGGTHILFNDGGHGIRNSAGKFARGVDVRGNGGYVILPPSAGYTVIDDSPIADMPAWLVALCQKAAIEASPSPRPARAALAIDNGTPYGLAALQSACDAIRNAFEGTKHETLNREAYSIGGLVSGGELIEGDAFRALSDALEDIRPACKDFRAAQRCLRRSFDEGKARARDVPELSAVPADLSNIAPYLAKLASQVAEEQRAVQAIVPAGVFAIDGLLKEIYDDCLASAYRPQPFLSLAAAISAVAVAAGRRYRTTTGLRPNVYAICVANSGAGKDHPLAYVREAIFSAGLPEYLGGEEIASGSGITTALAAHPIRLFCLDEMGMMLQAITGKKAAPYKAEIMQLFMKFFSRANSTFLGKQYADIKVNPRIDIQQPHVGILGATTPTTLWEALEGGALKDGSIARFMIFATDQNAVPRNKSISTAGIPTAILDGLKAISQGVPDHDYGGIVPGVMMAASSLNPYTVPYAPAAHVAMEVYSDRQETWQKKLANPNNVARAGEGEVVARIVEHATKLAMISAIGRSPEAPIIELQDVAWATLLTNHCADTLLNQAGRYVSDNEYEKKLGKAYDLVARFGPITMRDLIRRGFKHQERERSEILRTLTEGGLISATKFSPGISGGQPTVKYSVPVVGEANG